MNEIDKLFHPFELDGEYRDGIYRVYKFYKTNDQNSEVIRYKVSWDDGLCELSILFPCLTEIRPYRGKIPDNYFFLSLLKNIEFPLEVV